MDKTLIWNEEIINAINSRIVALRESLHGYEWYVWDEIPEEFKMSFYENEGEINPNNLGYDEWLVNLTRRPNPLFSVVVYEGRVVASVSSGNPPGMGRMINLWHVNNEHRGKGLGKMVILNILHVLYNSEPTNNITAWDITSQEVNQFLVSIGFT